MDKCEYNLKKGLKYYNIFILIIEIIFFYSDVLTDICVVYYFFKKA